MTSERPRIAIPEPTSTDEAYNQRSLPQYLRAIEAAGGISVPIPLDQSAAVQAGLLAACSGVLLPGSPADIDPALYEQEVEKETAPRDAPREAADWLLLEDVFEHGKPLLGICYGLQSLNVWRHGTLIQDLSHADVVNGTVVNHEPGPTVQEAHGVAVKPGSRLARLVSGVLGDPLRLSVNSSHHQAVDRLGEKLVVTATSSVDGMIEAVEGTNPTQFVVAVQWHPERSYESSATSRALFAAFLQAARSWAVKPENQ